MFHSFAYRLSNYLVDQNVVVAKDREIYEYGLEFMIATLTHVITSILIGIYFNMLFECVLFLVTYMPLRSYAGGMHASTHGKCYCISCIALVGLLLFLKVLQPAHYFIYILVGLPIAFLVIFFFAPVEDQNKPLDDLEIQHYRKKARMILLGEVAVIGVLMVLKFYLWAVVMTSSLALLGFLVCLGILKNKRLANATLTRD